MPDAESNGMSYFVCTDAGAESPGGKRGGLIFLLISVYIEELRWERTNSIGREICAISNTTQVWTAIG